MSWMRTTDNDEEMFESVEHANLSQRTPAERLNNVLHRLNILCIRKRLQEQLFNLDTINKLSVTVILEFMFLTLK